MLIINDQLVAIDEAIDQLVAQIVQLEVAGAYKKAKQEFLADQELQTDILYFQNLKENYDKMKEFANFRPEVSKMRRELFEQKRRIDLNDNLIHLRQCEVELQKLLAQLTKELSQAVSADIFVDTGLPFDSHKSPHKPGRGNNIKERNKDV